MSVVKPSPFFTTLLLPFIVVNANQKTKKGVGLGMQLL